MHEKTDYVSLASVGASLFFLVGVKSNEVRSDVSTIDWPEEDN